VPDFKLSEVVPCAEPGSHSVVRTRHGRPVLGNHLSRLTRVREDNNQAGADLGGGAQTATVVLRVLKRKISSKV
jgi:hypothetical protein